MRFRSDGPKLYLVTSAGHVCFEELTGDIAADPLGDQKLWSTYDYMNALVMAVKAVEGGHRYARKLMRLTHNAWSAGVVEVSLRHRDNGRWSCEVRYGRNPTRMSSSDVPLAAFHGTWEEVSQAAEKYFERATPNRKGARDERPTDY